MPHGSVFLDVGANVGLYALTAAVGRECTVYAFEPESQNFALLNQNIALNGISDQVTAFCAALSDRAELARLFLSRFDIGGGGSCHSFGAEVGFDLAPRISPFSQGSVAFRLDDLIAQGVMPVPNYMKVDVDGFEHKVMSGAAETLRDQRLREILIELNPAIPEHQHLVSELLGLGFYLDADQQRRARRKSGAFTGVGEVIFRRMPRDVLKIGFDSKPTGREMDEACFAAAENIVDHVLSRIDAATVVEQPFPYMVIDNFFPDDYFRRALENFPADGQMVPLSETGRTEGYRERLVSLFSDEHFARLDPDRRKFWLGFADWLYSDRFINGVVSKFWPQVACRLADLNRAGEGVMVHGDALIVSDQPGYEIGPHTDLAHRLITFLFYLPEDGSSSDLGTSIYAPLDPSLECKGGPHYPFELFEKLDTVAFLPNRVLVFVRNNQSFHGVEAVAKGSSARHLVINNIRIAGGLPPLVEPQDTSTQE
jgi:FkbM family methyltransferase